MDKEKLLELYPGYTSVLGPYARLDGRKHIVLNNANAAKGTDRKTKTVSYPKALLEIKLGRVLVGDETTDHIDKNKFNDSLDNLQVLSHADNARKSALGNKYALGFKQSYEQKRSGDKNGMSKLSSQEVLDYRRKFILGEISIYEIMSLTNMSNKSVRNFLFGDTYSEVDEKCIPGKPGRPRK